MSSLTNPSPLIQLLAMLKLKWGILVNDCQANTGWATQAGTVTIVTANKVVGPTNADREADYQEEGSYNLKATGTADASGVFQIKYTPSSSVNFSGTDAEEFAAGWITYFSIWIKAVKAGKFQIKLVDSAGKTAWWNITVTAGQKVYIHNTIGTYTGSDAGFDITGIASIRLGYYDRTANEASMEFRVNGPRVQGDPTFNSFDWGTAPLDNTMTEQCVTVGYAETYPSRRQPTPAGDLPHHFDLGPQPVNLRRRGIVIGYQIIADPDSQKSQGRARRYRDYSYEELFRILTKYTEYLSSKGIKFIWYQDHEVDDDLQSKPIRLRGYHLVRCHVFGNVHGAV